MAMLVYYTFSTVFPPRETYVLRTVESLDEDALDEQYQYQHQHQHAQGQGHAHARETSSGANSEGAEWEKASGGMVGSNKEKEQLAV